MISVVFMRGNIIVFVCLDDDGDKGDEEESKCACGERKIHGCSCVVVSCSCSGCKLLEYNVSNECRFSRLVGV